MKWPYKKMFMKGKRRFSQQQSHRANLHRVFRNQNEPTRRELRDRAISREASA